MTISVDANTTIIFKCTKSVNGKFEIYSNGRAIYSANVTIQSGNVRQVKLETILSQFTNTNYILISAVLYDGQSLETGVYDAYNNFRWDIPDIDKFKPSFEITTTPIDQVLNAYVTGKSSVQGIFTNAVAKYSASIKSATLYVGTNSSTVSTSLNPLTTTTKITQDGKVLVRAEVEDTRGLKKTIDVGYIDVYTYFGPTVVPTSEYNEVGIVVERAITTDEGIEFDSSGEELYIAAKKQYATLGGNNACKLLYRLKETFDGNWGPFKTLLSEDSSSTEYEGIITDTVDKKKIYYVELVAEDKTEAVNSTIIAIPSEEVFMEKAGKMNSIAFGGRVTQSNAFEVYTEGRFYNGLVLKPIETGVAIGIEMYSPNGTPYIITVSDAGALQIAKKGE